MFKSPRHAKFYSPARRRLPAFGLTLSLFSVALFFAAAQRAQAQAAGAHDIVISQIYTRGGEPGAAFQSDYVELFNAGTSVVDINNWSLQVRGVGGFSTSLGQFFIGLGQPYPVEPGHYVLLKLGSSGTVGAQLPAPDFNYAILDFTIPLISINADGAQVALLRPNATPPTAVVCPALPSDGIEDYVGFGSANCSEGGATAPAPGPTTALVRRGGGCADTDNNAADFIVLDAAPRNRSTAPAPCGPAASLSFFNFARPQFGAVESDGSTHILVTRTGDTGAAATVDYEVTDGTASERSDYTTAAGRLRFAPGETQKSFDVLLTDDGTQEQTETAQMQLSNPAGAGASLGLRDKATLLILDNDLNALASNPVDTSFFYVSQHYHDFLNRVPDDPGLLFWIQNVESCRQDSQCREVKRIDTSAAFFLSIEFQQTGYFVYRLYKAALPETPARPRALPRYREFMRDTQEVGRGVIVGQDGWQQRLEANTLAFLDEFVSRPEFVSNYPATMTPAEYVDKLNAQAGGPLTQQERDALVAGMIAGQETRASVLRKVADSDNFKRAEFDRAFVLMQYFGYLRRNPNDAPDADYTGYDFWLQKLDQFGGNYVQAEMVKAFISSSEYRVRFGL